jgi:hypothetical protein
MMGFTVWSCAALVAHFQMLISACLRAVGTVSAIAMRDGTAEIAEIKPGGLQARAGEANVIEGSAVLEKRLQH